MTTSAPRPTKAVLKPSRTSIFQFKDYRLFLRSRFEFQKENRKGVSLESVARRIGISKSYTRYIFECKRHVTLDLVPKIAKAFSLDRNEHQTLIYMVCRDTCEEPSAKQFFQSIISNLSDNGWEKHLREKVNVQRSWELFSNSLSMTIHSLAKQRGFQADAAWIQRRLTDKTASLLQIKSCLDFLISSQAIVQQESGGWKPSSFVFNKPGENALNGYQIYKVGLDAMLTVCDRQEQFKPYSFHMTTLSFDENNIDEVSQIIKNCRDSLISASQKTEQPTHVVLINLNSACMARRQED